MARHISSLSELDAKLTAKITHGFARMEEAHTFTRRLIIGVMIAQTVFNSVFVVKLFF